MTARATPRRFPAVLLLVSSIGGAVAIVTPGEFPDARADFGGLTAMGAAPRTSGKAVSAVAIPPGTPVASCGRSGVPHTGLALGGGPVLPRPCRGSQLNPQAGEHVRTGECVKPDAGCAANVVRLPGGPARGLVPIAGAASAEQGHL